MNAGNRTIGAVVQADSLVASFFCDLCNELCYDKTGILTKH